MTTRRAYRSKLAAGVLAGVLLLAACGGGGDGDSAAGDSVASASDDSDDVEGEANAARIEGEVEAPAPASDEVAVRPESELPTNPLPDLVVDNLSLDTKVNLRNVVPNELPVLLWMWAPW